MTIQQILANLKNKTYGEDVRQAIIDGLQLCYTDKALGGYCPVDNLNNYYSGSAFCTSSTANSPFQSSFIVMCAGNSTNCFQVAINASNANDGYVRNKKNNSWSAWMRLGVSKKIRYWNYDGSELLYTESVSSGGNGIWDGTSTRDSTQQYDYTFVGWSTIRNATAADSNATKNVTANRDVYAAFTPVLRSYNVYFFNGTALLDTVTVPYGSNATFEGNTPTKDSTAQYDYSFVGWNSHNGESSAEVNVLNDIRDNKTVYAAFTSIVRSYNVYFYNGASLIFTDSVEYGSSAEFEGTTPTKASTAQYSYMFSGWNADSTAETADVDALTNVVSDRTVYAVFTSMIRTYTVRFMNGATVLQTIINVPYGSNAEYTGENPQHPTAPEEYTFAGFNPDGTNVQTNTDCQAVYILNPKELRYWNYDGTELLHTELVEVGADGSWNGTSSRESTAEHSYIFLGWNTSKNASVVDANATKNVTDDRDVYAAFEETVRSYSVYFYNGSTLLYTALVQYGEDASYVGSTPTKASTVQYDYHFEGWNSQDEQSSAESGILNNITADKTVYAAFSSSLVVYHVYFYNGASLIFTDDVEYGNNASFDGTNPTKDPTSEYEYTFVGWNSQNDQSSEEANVLNNITADKTVYAAYTSALRHRTVYFYNGSTLLGSVVVLRGGNASDSTITTPTKDSTAQYNYTFVGWNSQDEQSVAEAGVLDNILEDKNVYAAFSAELRSYDVIFYNGSTLLQTVSVQYGGTAVCSGTTPTKASTAQYTYTHSGWNTNSSATTADVNALTNITANRTVYAMFTEVARSYDVKFYNGSTLLKTVSVTYGEDATYSGATPTKASTLEYAYTFSGWNTNSSATSADANALKNVTAERTVYAIFTASVRRKLESLSTGTKVYLYENGAKVPYIYVGKSSSGDCMLLRERVYSSQRTMHSAMTDSYSGTTMDTWLNNRTNGFLALFDANTYNAMKVTTIKCGNSKTLVVTQISRRCFLPSYSELGFTYSAPNDGTSYLSVLKSFYGTSEDNTARIAKDDNGNTVAVWYTRTGYDASSGSNVNKGFETVSSMGYEMYIPANYEDNKGYPRPVIAFAAATPVSPSGSTIYLLPATHGN